MHRLILWLAASGLLLALAGPSAAADPQKFPRPEPSAKAAALSARIDEMLAATWSAQKITPAETASDAEFLRRVYLDLAGRLPTVTEARTFLADTRTDKRKHLVAELLDRPTYARHFTTIWRRLLLPEADANLNFAFVSPGFEGWLRKQFAKNVPYDQMVRE